MTPPLPPNLDADQIIALCIGRILRMGSRPERPGDGAEYDRIRGIALDAAERAGYRYRGEDARPSWVRDRARGAQGD